jgi:hypothetical protein
LNHRSSEAKSWPVILVARKATPTLINRPSSLLKTRWGGAASSMTGAFDIAEEARQRGRVDDDVAWRGVKNRREAKKDQLSTRGERISISPSGANRNETESRREAKRTLITALRHEAPCRRNEIGSCREPKRKLINAAKRDKIDIRREANRKSISP